MIRVLFVDDLKIFRETAKIFIEQSGGFSVDIVESAEAALEKFDDTTYDAIVSDYMMPDMDGIEFLKTVRTMDENIPFILITGRGEEEVAIKAINNGANGYLCKRRDDKNTFAELPNKIRQAVEHRQAKETVSRTHEMLQQQTKNLFILNEIISAANRAENLPELFRESLDKIMLLLDFDAGGIYLADPNVGAATVMHAKNLPAEFLLKVSPVPLNTPPYDTLFVKNEPIFSDNFEKISPELSGNYGFSSLASVPLLSKGHAVGALNVISKRRNTITDPEKLTLMSIGLELGATMERMTAENEAKRSAGNFATLFNSIEEMVFVLDMQGRILKVNDTVPKRLLYAPDELLGTNVLDLHVPERRDEALRIVQGMIAGTIDTCPVPLLAKDGTRIDVETKVTRGLWNGSEVLIGVSRDITERKRVEEALHESKVRVDQLAGLSRIITWEVDSRGLYTDISPVSASVWGYLPEELVGLKHFYDLHPESDREAFRSSCFSVFERKEPFQNLVNCTLSKEGRAIWVSTNGIPLINNDGTLRGYRGSDTDITERKQAEDTLLLLSDRLSLAARAGHVGIWDYDVVNNLLNWDDQMFALYGIKREQFSGAYEAWQEGVHPDDRIRGDAEIQQALRGDGEFNTEFKVLWPDGSIHTIRALALVQRDASGKPLRMVGTNWDITDRIHAEAAIRESEEQIRLLLDSTAEAIYGLDMKGNCTFCNNSCLRLLGYRHPDELLGRNMHWQIHHKHPDGSHFPVEECRIFQAFNKGEGTHVDDEVLWRSDGTSFPAEYWSYPQRRNGVVVGAVVTFLDITARKKAEQALLQSEEKYRHLIDNSHDIIYTITPEGIFTFVSPSWTALLGQPVGEVVGRPFQQFIHTGDLPGCLVFLQKTIDTGQRQTGIEYRVQRADGTWRWHTSNAVPLKDEAGTVIGFEGTANDITDRKRAEEAQQQLETMLRLILTLSNRFINVAPPDIDAEIQTGLAEIGSFAHVDRSYVFLFSPDGSKMSNSHEWCAEGISPQKDSLQDLPVELFPAWMKQLQSFETIHIPRVSDLPDDAKAEKEILQAQDIKSVLVVPLVIQNNLIGFLGFDNVCEERIWQKQVIALLEVTAKIIANAKARKTADAALKNSEEQLSLVIEGSGAGLWDWRVQTGEIIINERWAEIIGYTLAELKPVSIQTWMKYGHPEDLKHSEELLEKHFLGECLEYECEARMRHKDGRWVWVLDRGKVVARDPDGRPVRMTGTHLDITERKRSEKILEHRTALLTNLLDSIPDIVFFKDTKGVYLGCNPPFADFVGRTHAEIVGHTDYDLFSKE
ncbi:MAG: PAS domain S-box protein, partial [Methanoregula sp.]|nr:PAS domain S-box protein [Methanoregula sp.]